MNFHFVKIEAYWSSLGFILPICFRLCWPTCQAADSWHQRRFQSLVKLFGTDEPSIHIKEFEKDGKSKVKRNVDVTLVAHFLRCFWILTEIFRTSPVNWGDNARIFIHVISCPHLKKNIIDKKMRFLFASHASHLSHHVISALERPTQLHPQISCDMQWQGMTSMTPGKLNKWWQMHPCFRSRGSSLNKP